MKTIDKAKLFGLENEVEGFVNDKIKDMANEIHEFEFVGHRTGRDGVHAPQVIEYYENGKGEQLKVFTLGREGMLPDGSQLHIVVEEYVDGDPETPDYARGYWFVKK